MRFEALAVHTAANHVAIDFRVTVELDAGRMIIQGIEVFTVADDGLISAVVGLLGRRRHHLRIDRVGRPPAVRRHRPGPTAPTRTSLHRP